MRPGRDCNLRWFRQPQPDFSLRARRLALTSKPTLSTRMRSPSSVARRTEQDHVPGEVDGGHGRAGSGVPASPLRQPLSVSASVIATRIESTRLRSSGRAVGVRDREAPIGRWRRHARPAPSARAPDKSKYPADASEPAVLLPIRDSVGLPRPHGTGAQVIRSNRGFIEIDVGLRFRRSRARTQRTSATEVLPLRARKDGIRPRDLKSIVKSVAPCLHHDARLVRPVPIPVERLATSLRDERRVGLHATSTVDAGEGTTQTRSAAPDRQPFS